MTITNSNGLSLVLSRHSDYILENIDGLGDVDASTQMQSSPYQDGANYIDSILEPRNLSVDFFFKGRDDTDISTKRSQLARLLNPKAGLLKIRYQYGDIVREIEGVAEHVPKYASGQGNRGFNYQRGVFNLICPDPFWKSLHQTTRGLKAYEPKFVLPVTLPASMGEVGDFTSVLNEGDVEAPVLITVSGPVVNPEITNETTGETLRINVTLSLDEVLYIDTDPRRKRVEIFRGGAFYRTAFGLIDRNYAKSSLWKLAPGENNLSYVADEGNENATVVVQWNDRFVAV